MDQAFEDEQMVGLSTLITRLSEELGDGSGLTSRTTSAAVPRFTPFTAINPGYEFEHSDMLEPDIDELHHLQQRRMSGGSAGSGTGYLDPVPFSPSATPTSFSTAHGHVSTKDPGKLNSADRLASEVIAMVRQRRHGFWNISPVFLFPHHPSRAS